MLHVFHNDEEWVIAEDETDAWTVWEEHTGEERKDHDEIEWTQLADDEPLSLLVDSPADEWQTRTCAEWAAANGRGYFASVDF